MILENYEFVPRTVRIKNEEGYLFTVNHSTDYKRTKKDADEIAKMIVNAVNSFDELLSIAKTVKFWFGNEANYPEGTAGNRICKEAIAAIEKAEKK